MKIQLYARFHMVQKFVYYFYFHYRIIVQHYRIRVQNFKSQWKLLNEIQISQLFPQGELNDLTKELTLSRHAAKLLLALVLGNFSVLKHLGSTFWEYGE